MRGTCSPFRLSSGLKDTNPTALEAIQYISKFAQDKVTYDKRNFLGSAGLNDGNYGYGLGSQNQKFCGTLTVSDTAPTVSCFQGSHLNPNKN